MTKRIVRCEACQRKYDASRKKVGDRFRCRCGQIVRVPEDKGHDAAVVRCSGCGAAREAGATACAYCGSDFTLHECDLNTICANCQTRVSSSGRFCHHCGSRIAPDSLLGEASNHSCPACGPERLLHAKHLPGLQIQALECQVCAGLWLDLTTMHNLLEDESRRPGGFVVTHRHPEMPKEIFYRKCVHCQGLMSRRNFGRSSGVMLDICGEHGIWFDAEELAHLLAWIRAGGLEIAQRETAKLVGSPDALRRKFVPKVAERKGMIDLELDRRLREGFDPTREPMDDLAAPVMLFLANLAKQFLLK